MDTTIEYIISASGEISPITPQPGGVLGDDNTVTLCVDMSAITVGEKEYIRIDIANGSGGFNSSEHLTLSDGKVTYKLPYEVTSAGGTAQAHLVIVEYDGGVSKIRYSFPMRIYFKDSTAGTAGYALYSKDLSGLMLKAKEEADRANECSAAAQSLMEESQRQATAADNSAKSAAAAASSAADSAVRAASSADSAWDAAYSAANYASAAAAKADSAHSSAESSEHNASAAAGSAASATAAASSAADSAVRAASSEESAANSASAAAASEANIANAISDHDADSNAHGALFGSVNTQLQGISGGLAAAVAKGNATADTVALLQKYPCYEYATSGGAVQRFDDVSRIAHTIGVTVHGATDESGNSVVNPMLSVYGKNLCPVAGWTNKNIYLLNAPVVAGVKYTFSITISKLYSGSTTGFKLYIGSASGTLITSVYSKPIGQYSVTFTPSASGMLYYSGFGFIDAENVQLEVGSTATEYEPYKEPQTVTVPMTFPEGNVCEIGVLNAVSPNMTVIASDDNGLVSAVDVTYNRDIGKALGNLQAAIAALA